MTGDNRRDEQDKVDDFNKLISVAEEKIHGKENDLEMLEAQGSDGYQSVEYFDEVHEDDENNHSNRNVVKRGITRLYKFCREYGKPDGIKLSVTFDALNRRYFNVDLTVKKLKETKDKIKEGTLKVDYGTDAMKIVLGKEKGGYARGVGIGVTYKSNANEEGETTVVGCENDASIQKSNGLATLEEEMETRHVLSHVIKDDGWFGVHEDEKDTEEEEKDPKEDLEKDPEEEPEDDDDDMEMDDEAEVIDPYMDDGSINTPPPNSEDEETPPTSYVIPDADETPPTSPVIPDADGQPIPPIASFGQNFHFGESSSTANLLTGNSDIVPTGPMCPNLGTAWKGLGKMEKLMSERIDIEGRVKKKFKEQDRYFVGLGCDNIEIDRTVRNVMSDLSGLKKLVKGLSDRFDEYERSKVFEAKRVLEKELVNERNGKEFYQEFSEYMCRMLQNRQKSEGSFPLPLDAAIVAAAIATSSIDDDDDTTPMDSQPHEPHGSPRDT
uniref:Uncharacterized protein n=1 Tax=Tanacetum cinerariifolium TaxID=118510 RepID=A0A6L2K6B1_TANCI|nr:hypothetical protein [Tanacetum cinerariifolium]